MEGCTRVGKADRDTGAMKGKGHGVFVCAYGAINIARHTRVARGSMYADVDGHVGEVQGHS